MIFFESIYEVCKKLPKEDRAQIYEAVIAYGCEGIEPENLSMLAEAVFGMAKPLIDRSNKCKAAGIKGGRPRKTTGKFVNFEQSGTDWDSVADEVIASQ